MTTKINATISGIIESVDTSGILEFQTGNSSALIINTDQSANFAGNTALTVPNGTTAQRPTPVNGMIRYNTTTSSFETYSNNAWGVFNLTFAPVSNVAPVVSAADAAVGTTISVSNGTWNNSPTSYTYQWLANSSAIGGATSNSFTLSLSQVGANVSCNVTAINVAGNTTAQSNAIGPVVNTFNISYLSVAGGGGGNGGGGGAGGMLANSVTVTGGTTYTITVGAGGGQGGQGSNSTITGTGLTTILSYGGGYASNYYGVGGNGGSGGGGAGGNGNYNAGGSGVAGQGNAGAYYGAGSGNYLGGGGGGAGAAASGQNGGTGLQSSITGSAVYYAGGGGGGGNSGQGSGGSGGGASGTVSGANFGSANTGGGGGGAYNNTGGGGGSGIVILSIPTSKWSNVYTGTVTITTSGSNTIATFTGSGTYTA